MLAAIKNMMSRGQADGSNGSEQGNDTEIALTVLLLDAAHADGECSADERDHVITTLVDTYAVDREDIEELLDQAYRKRADAVDLFNFTRHLNQQLSAEEKSEVMCAVWRIILSDGRLEAHEDHLAHKLGNLLRLTHKELIAAKLAARQQLQQSG